MEKSRLLDSNNNAIEIKIHNSYFDLIWTVFSKFHLNVILTCLVPIVAKFFFDKFHGHQVTLEFHDTKDIFWIRNLQKNILSFNDQDQGRMSSSVVSCKAICRPGTTSNLSIDFGSECTSFPLLIIDSTSNEKQLRTTTRAKASLPCFLRLDESIIPKANKGIFTNVFLPKGLLFGPYEGFVKRPQDATFSLYIWVVELMQPVDGEKQAYVDGDDELFSNWLRWVNSARYEEEQNVIPLHFNGSIYYYLYKDVQPGSELLVWYGTIYGKHLGIINIPGTSHFKESHLAPAKSITLCPSCTWNLEYVNSLYANLTLQLEHNKNDTGMDTFDYHLEM